MKKFVPGKTGKSLLFVALFAAILAIAYGSYGFLYNKDPFTGKIYDEMDGMIPFLVLLSSIPFLLIALFTGIFLKRK